MIALLMLIGTFFDYWIHSIEDSQLSKEALANPLVEIFLAFSVYSNSKRLFDLSSHPRSIDCLNGFRVLSILFIVCGHTFMMSATLPVSKLSIHLVSGCWESFTHCMIDWCRFPFPHSKYTGSAQLLDGFCPSIDLQCHYMGGFIFSHERPAFDLFGLE